SVIGNQHQLELKLDRKLGEIEQLQAQARQALVLADQARAQNDEAKAAEFEETASMLAGQLVTAEASAAQLKQLHDQSLGAAQQARQAVRDNELRMQEKLAERTKLLSQLEQAKMQEQVAASLSQVSEIAAPKNTPSLDEVRDKIERRYANALGQADLASTSTQGRLLEVKKATVDMAAQSRLAEIRAELGQGTAGRGSATPPSLDKPAPAIAESPAATADGQPSQHKAEPAG
ncbi:MAG TPA: PspA/IM30 family protein, partial [Jatrophihabitans sp.]|nr:PspA/IM30 family protein [Jatrophihabitans sp.]